MRRYWIDRALIATLFASSLLMIAPATSQDAVAAQRQRDSDATTTDGDQQKDTKTTVRVYRVRFASVQSLLPTVQAIFADAHDMRFSADPRTNCVIVFGTEDEHSQVAELLETLDAETPEPSLIKTFPMNDIELSISSDVLRLLRGDVDIAATDGMLIVRGQKEAVDEVTQLLSLLDRHREVKQELVAEPVGDVSVEITWLAETEQESVAKFAGPLAAILKKRGFGNVAEIGTLHVSVSVGSQAIVAGAALNGMLEAQLSIEQTESEGTLKMSLDLEGNVDDSPTRFSTEMTTPLNHWIVLGVASPKASAEEGKKPPKSVFLVRVRPRETLASE